MNQAQLSIPNLEAGTSFLNRLPLANPAAAEQHLTLFLQALLDAPPDSSDLFILLEQARLPLNFAEEEMASRFRNKALPLPELEEAGFQRVIELWRMMARAYARCAEGEAVDGNSPEYAAHIATLLHRCLFYTGMVMLEHYRARRELPSGLWLELHGYFASAEEWGVANIPVVDALDRDQQTTHCTAAYVTQLLLELASPYSQSVRDLNLIRRWAGMWAPLVGVFSLAEESEEIPGFVIELMRDVGMHPTPAEELTTDIRRLDTSRLGMQLTQTLQQLRQRIPPSQLNLGEETNTHVTQLLTQLSRPWTQSAAPRKFRRFPTSGQTRVAIGFEAMHFFISGKEFEQPDSKETYSRDQFNTLFTFRHMAEPAQKLTVEAPKTDYPCDTWEVINHSASGFRLRRTAVGQKMLHGQLLAICPHDGQRFILGQSCWLMQEQQEGGLIMGMAILPGMPSAVGVRLSETPRGGSDRFVRAFLISSVPAIGAEGSLVLPLGLYQASQLLDVVGEENAWQVKMKNILQRGVDFERISYERV